jgi:hypothetical protein
LLTQVGPASGFPAGGGGFFVVRVDADDFAGNDPALDHFAHLYGVETGATLPSSPVYFCRAGSRQEY